MGAPWKAATSFSSDSVKGEFPSSRREPPEPSLKCGEEESSCRKAFLNMGEVVSERKSLDEKSMEEGGAVVRARRAEWVLRLERRDAIVDSKDGDWDADSMLTRQWRVLFSIEVQKSPEMKRVRVDACLAIDIRL